MFIKSLSIRLKACSDNNLLSIGFIHELFCVKLVSISDVEMFFLFAFRCMQQLFLAIIANLLITVTGCIVTNMILPKLKLLNLELCIIDQRLEICT